MTIQLLKFNVDIDQCIERALIHKIYYFKHFNIPFLVLVIAQEHLA